MSTDSPSDGRQFIAATVSPDRAAGYDNWDRRPGAHLRQNFFIIVFGIN